MYRRRRCRNTTAPNLSFFDLYGERWLLPEEGEILTSEDLRFLKTPSPYGEKGKDCFKEEERPKEIVPSPVIPIMPETGNRKAKKVVLGTGRSRTKMCAMIKRKLRSFSTKAEPLKIKSYTDDESIVTINGVDFNLQVDRNGNVRGISMCKYYGKDEPSTDTKGLPFSGLDYLDDVGWCKSADVEVSDGTVKSVAEEIRRMYRISTDW